MNALRTIRYRDGAVFWGLFSDVDKPGRYIEYFMVESWAEHVRQHSRATDEDAPALERARIPYSSGPTHSIRPNCSYWAIMSAASALVSIVILAYEAEKRHQK